MIGGFDLLSRLLVRGKPIPAFVLPGPPPAHKSLPYPRPLPPREASELSLKCSAGGPTGTTVKFSGTLSPAQTGVDVTVTYAPIRGFGVGATHTVSTDLNGNFGDSFTPQGAGDFIGQASWTGNGALQPSKSNSCTFGIG